MCNGKNKKLVKCSWNERPYFELLIKQKNSIEKRPIAQMVDNIFHDYDQVFDFLLSPMSLRN